MTLRKTTFAPALGVLSVALIAAGAQAQQRPSKKADLLYSCTIEQIGAVGSGIGPKVNVPMEVLVWSAEGICERKLLKTNNADEASRIFLCKVTAQTIDGAGTKTNVSVERANGNLRGTGWVNTGYVGYRGTCKLVK